MSTKLFKCHLSLFRWQKLKELFSEQLSTLRTLSSKWTSYNEEYNNAVNWLNKKESDIERLLQNDLREDKEGQLKDITVVVSSFSTY